MIPLRFLHLIPGTAAPEHRPASALVLALGQRGHHGGWLLPGQAAESDSHHVRFPGGWFRWWRGGRDATVSCVAAWSPDLIHVHGLTHLGTAIELARRLGLSVVVTLYRCEDPYAARRLRDPLVRWVLVPSEHHRSYTQSVIGVDRDRIATVPPAVTPGAMTHGGVGDGSWTIGTPFGAERWRCDQRAMKGWMSAVAEIQSAGLPMAAVVACDASRAAAVQALAQSSGAVIRTCPEDALTGHCDVLCLPSDREVPADLVLHAQAAGLPVVAVVTGGLPELVRDGSTAVLIPRRDQHLLANALRSLHDREHRLAMAAAAIELSREHYAAPLVATAVESVYRSMLGTPEPGTTNDVTRSWRRMTAHHRS